MPTRDAVRTIARPVVAPSPELRIGDSNARRANFARDRGAKANRAKKTTEGVRRRTRRRRLDAAAATRARVDARASDVDRARERATTRPSSTTNARATRARGKSTPPTRVGASTPPPPPPP